jgi:hypothetical protein
MTPPVSRVSNRAHFSTRKRELKIREVPDLSINLRSVNRKLTPCPKMMMAPLSSNCPVINRTQRSLSRKKNTLARIAGHRSVFGREKKREGTKISSFFIFAR